MGVGEVNNGSKPEHVTWPDNDDLIKIQQQAESPEDVFGDADELAQIAKNHERGQMSRLSRWRAERSDRKQAVEEARRIAEHSAQEFTDLKPEDPADSAMWDEPIPGTEPKPKPAAEPRPTYTKEEVEGVDWDEKY